MLSVIIPANNEAGYIGECLDSLMIQTITPEEAGGLEIIVSANACTDATAAIAESYRDRAEARGWALIVLDLERGGKPYALNEADKAASGDMRVYLDADIVCDADIMRQIHRALDRPDAIYASGRLEVAPAESWITRHYARLWTRLPFMTDGVPGAGLFAVNAAGRARWGDFPGIISDDGYVRLLFRPEERVGVEAPYQWPMVEGFSTLVKVRRRQDAGGAEIRDKYPDIIGNEAKLPVTPADHLRLFLGTPVSYLVYIAVSIAVRMQSHGPAWTRGR